MQKNTQSGHCVLTLPQSLEVLPVVRKDNANERNESMLSNCRVQLIFCKDKH